VKEHFGNLIVAKYLMTFIAFLYIGYIYLVFSESIFKKFFTMFSVWIFSLITLSVAISVTGTLVNTNPKYLQIISYLLRFAIQLLFLAAAYLWLAKPYKRVLAIVSDKTIMFMSIYLFIAFLLLINNYTPTFAGLRSFESEYDMILLLAFIIIGYVIVFAGISSSSKTISLQYNYKIVENQIELQRQNYRMLSEGMEKLYALKHDVRHHISAIETMIAQQKYKEAMEYIEQFNQNELTKTIPVLCSNYAADSIIKYYMSLAISKNIDFETDLTIPEAIGINSLDLCVILGNALENAVEACEKLNAARDKNIMVTSKIVKNHIVLVITNSYNGEIATSGDVIKSAKSGPGHGIGLSSIRQTVNKYNGNLDIKYTPDTFEVAIIMSINTPTPDVSS
jgi:signal transduction histidine kinase